MKKVLKSRIFIVLICGIIFTSLGVYGATIYPYKANEISYNPSNGEPTNVNDALNELYENMNNNQCSINFAFRIGDYIKMTPTSTSYTISSSLTGYSSNQTINPSELNLWRVIKVNENGTVEIISENVSSTSVNFTGLTGYLNFVGTLNLIASQYGNSKYTIGSRIIGYGGQTEYITNTSKFTYNVPWTYYTRDNSNETVGGGDIMYLADTNLVTEVLGTLKATNPSGTATLYWMGSRVYNYYHSDDYCWIGRYVSNDGTPLSGYSSFARLFAVDGTMKNNTAGAPVRPILILKSGLTATGSGIKSDPFILE